MKKPVVVFLHIMCVVVLSSLLAGCAGWNPNQEQDDAEQVKITIERFLERDPGLKVFFDKAYGYAIFPNVGKGAYIVGGSYGNGFVYEQGNLIGYANIVAASIGLQIGGQGFSEIIFFKDQMTLNDFKRSSYEFNAQASAIAVNLGVAAKTDYNLGVAIFILPKGGLMADLSAGGQKFTFEPK
jgi:lipid-binding SYLF domain-containing protein